MRFPGVCLWGFIEMVIIFGLVKSSLILASVKFANWHFICELFGNPRVSKLQSIKCVLRRITLRIQSCWNSIFHQFIFEARFEGQPAEGPEGRAARIVRATAAAVGPRGGKPTPPGPAPPGDPRGDRGGG